LDYLTTTFHDSLTLFDLSQATAAEKLTLNGNGQRGYFPQIETLVPGPVSYIADGAFDDAEKLKTVDFSHSPELISIGEDGFDHTTSLESVNLSDCTRLTTIGDGAFYYCSSLKSFDFTALPNLTTIGESAFDACYALNEVDYSGCPNLSTIGLYAFFTCNALKSVDFSGCTRLTSIGNYSFYTDNAMDVYFRGTTPPANCSGKLSDSFWGWQTKCTLHLSAAAKDNPDWNNFIGTGWKSIVYDQQ
ncbi:MAG: leucine-rich repeat domain-containing protein, partial [Paraprevotella sp.]|nr:leucine-rich repeat domain-containing protein [Paraprevotella sp.]